MNTTQPSSLQVLETEVRALKAQIAVADMSEADLEGLPTPRTDAAKVIRYVPFGSVGSQAQDMTHADFAMALERESAFLSARLIARTRDLNAEILRLTEENREFIASDAQLKEVKETLWTNQTGMPNIHRDASIAIKTIMKLSKDRIDALEAREAALREELSNYKTMNTKFILGDRVCKSKGSSWHGIIVGTYSTSLTPEGYCVESERETGSVQIYPASALELIECKP